MTDDLDKVVQRTQRYWYQDGLPEIAVGFLFLVGGLAVSLMANPIVDPGTTLALLLALGLLLLSMAAVIVLGRGLRRTLEAIKSRVTYPRTGYVSYRRPAPRPRTLPAKIGLWVALMLISMVVGGVLGYVLGMLAAAGLPMWVLSMSTTQGVLLAIALVIMGYRYGLVRFYVLAVLSLVTGVLAALNDMAFGGAALYFVTMGAILALSGLATLAIYLWRNRLPEDA